MRTAQSKCRYWFYFLFIFVALFKFFGFLCLSLSFPLRYDLRYANVNATRQIEIVKTKTNKKTSFNSGKMWNTFYCATTTVHEQTDRQTDTQTGKQTHERSVDWEKWMVGAVGMTTTKFPFSFSHRRQSLLLCKLQCIMSMSI